MIRVFLPPTLLAVLALSAPAYAQDVSPLTGA